MGEWTSWTNETFDKGDCGECEKVRERDVSIRCEHGGDCNCTKEEKKEDCSKPCRKYHNTNA